MSTIDFESWKAAKGKGGKEAAPLIVVSGREPCCWGHTITIDETKRSVRCAKCQKEFTPFEAVQYLARDWKHYAQNREALKKDIGALAAERERLKQEVRNLKAQVRRAEASSAAIAGPIAGGVKGGDP